MSLVKISKSSASLGAGGLFLPAVGNKSPPTSSKSSIESSFFFDPPFSFASISSSKSIESSVFNPPFSKSAELSSESSPFSLLSLFISEEELVANFPSNFTGPISSLSSVAIVLLSSRLLFGSPSFGGCWAAIG